MSCAARTWWSCSIPPPDLARFDLDVSRFIRDADDLDVQVFWREVRAGERPNPDQPSGTAPRRAELCPVPVNVFREFARKRRAFRWDVLERQWGPAPPRTILPGQIFLIPADQGGYTALTGWDAESTVPVTPVPSQTEQTFEANDDDGPSQSGWQRIGDHADEVTAEVTRLADALELPDVLGVATKTAGRWHDRGKAQAVFEDAIADGPPGRGERPEAWRGCRDLAKAPKPFWQGYSRNHFRHELATGLAMLQAGLPDLVVYLATAHHGKVRLSIRSLPNEHRPSDPTQPFARGVWEGDPLPVTDLGGGIIAPAVTLHLEAMTIGLTNRGQPSWTERMVRLRDAHGPFVLAFLEAVLRAADMRASRAHAHWGGESYA
jgi:CRISPR-associated endonuclease/helicase Cas3